MARGDATFVEWDVDADTVSERINGLNVAMAMAQGRSERVKLSQLADPESPSMVSLLHAWTDALSDRTQSRYRLLVYTVLAMEVLSVVVMDQTLSSPSRDALVLQVVTIGSTLAAWRWLNSRHLRDSFEQCRALAEGAQVQEVWQRIRLRTSVADDLELGHAAEFGWIRRTLRTAWFVEKSNR